MITLQLNQQFIIRSLWVIALLMAFLLVYPEFVKINTFSAVALLTLPLSFGHTRHGKQGLFWILLVLGLLGLLVPTTTGIFLYLCLMIALIAGGTNSLGSIPALIHIGLITPLFQYINSLLSFPLRIALSKVTASLLSPFWRAYASGNLIVLEGNEYLVDQACAGLFMLKYGILFGTLLLSWKLRTHTLSTGKILASYTILLSLILLANIIRILILVLGDIGADHWLHEVIGLAIYALAVLWPFYAVVEKLSKHEKASKKHLPIFGSNTQLSLLAIVYFLMLLANGEAGKTKEIQHTSIPGYSRKVLESGVWQFEKPDALIYIKPPVAAYRSDHNPMICWAGSGFEFKKVNQTRINGETINFSELQKGREKLYSAWWFESTEHRTGHQWTWRKHSLLDQEEFHLINLTCKDPETLKINLKILLDEPSLFN